MLRVPRQVLVYLFRHGGDADFEVLLLKRTDTHGGFWQGVTGAPEWDENDVECAIREVREETGFEVETTLRKIGFRYQLRREGDVDHEHWERLYGPEVLSVPEEVYVAEVPAGRDPVLAQFEHDAFKWCTVDEELSLLLWENNRDALVAARQFVESGAA